MDYRSKSMIEDSRVACPLSKKLLINEDLVPSIIQGNRPNNLQQNLTERLHLHLVAVYLALPHQDISHYLLSLTETCYTYIFIFCCLVYLSDVKVQLCSVLTCMWLLCKCWDPIKKKIFFYLGEFWEVRSNITLP